MAKRVKKELTIKSPQVRVGFGLLILVIGIAITVSPIVSDASFMSFVTTIFGLSGFFWGTFVMYIAAGMFVNKPFFSSKQRFFGLLLFAITASIFFSYMIPKEELYTTTDFSNYGGTLGKSLHIQLVNTFGRLVEMILIIVSAVIAFSLSTETGLDVITEKIVGAFESIKEKADEKRARKEQEKDTVIIDDSVSSSGDDDYIGSGQISQPMKTNSDDQEQIELHIEEGTDIAANNVDKGDPFIGGSTTTSVKDTQGDSESSFVPQYPNWEFPSLEILSEPVMQPQDKEVHKRNAVIIEKTLRSFDIESKVNKITIGPTIVQYALSITIGTKVARVKNLTNDLALALATSESQIRIEAPIPGTSLIGIEIPNPTPNFVYIRDLVKEIRQNYPDMELPLVLGKNVAGKSLIKDLTKLPHLLVAGATGTGKSVGINSIITGLLMMKTPDELRLILVDPKMVELAPYNGLPHLLVPVITDMELVTNALQWAVEEMTTRYRILKQSGTKNIVEYNKKCPETKLPYIVIIIDEMADLMLSTGADVESRVVRLTQMARAVGIHMILATQRPDVNIITGIIKANVPGRMAFSVSSQVDSRVVIDQVGAETLIGMGDMLFKAPDFTKPLRLQGAFTSTQDTEALVQYMKEQAGGNDESNYLSEVIKPEPKITANGVTGMNDLSEDELFEDALEIVLNTQKGSASMLQRRLKIGYNRAARLIEEFEDLGVVGRQDGSNPREVLISSKEELINRLKSRGGGEDDTQEQYEQ